VRSHGVQLETSVIFMSAEGSGCRGRTPLANVGVEYLLESTS